MSDPHPIFYPFIAIMYLTVFAGIICLPGLIAWIFVRPGVAVVVIPLFWTGCVAVGLLYALGEAICE